MALISESVDHLLVLRALGLGDLLTAVPALRGLRRAFPAATLTLATHPGLTDLVGLIGGVDRLCPTTALAELTAGPVPGLAVNLHGSGPESHRDLVRSGAATIWAYAHPELPGLPGPTWVEDEPEVRRWCRLLSWYGVPADPADRLLGVPARPSPAPGTVVLHPGASALARRWPAPSFAAVAARLASSGHRVLITGSEAEQPLATEVAALAGIGDDDVLAGRTDLDELAALVAGASLVISGDTGVAHLASAYGTRSVVIFGPASPQRWGPPADGPHAVVWSGATGDPRADRPDPALAAIPVDRVLDAAAALLSGSDPAGGGRATMGRPPIRGGGRAPAEPRRVAAEVALLRRDRRRP